MTKQEQLAKVYTDFALEMLNKEIRDFIVYTAPPHIVELYTRLLTAWEAEEDEYVPPNKYSWGSDNPYAGVDDVKAHRWEIDLQRLRANPL